MWKRPVMSDQWCWTSQNIVFLIYGKSKASKAKKQQKGASCYISSMTISLSHHSFFLFFPQFQISALLCHKANRWKQNTVSWTTPRHVPDVKATGVVKLILQFDVDTQKNVSLLFFPPCPDCTGTLLLLQLLHYGLKKSLMDIRPHMGNDICESAL